MRKRFSQLLILVFFSSTVAAHSQVREKVQGRADAANTAQRKVEEAQRKTQAIDILKGVVESAGEIQKAQTRVALLSASLDLLWKHDEAYARANFVKAADALSDRFASDPIQKNERAEIRATMGVLLRAFARHDPKAAARLLDKFQKLLEDVLKGNTLSPGERLSLAQASLESDAAQSAALAAKVLETGVPGAFPSYLNELEQRDAAAAANLFRVALSIVTAGRIYSPVQVTVLSSYVFRESSMSVPVIRAGEGVPLESGMFASPLSPPSRELNQALVRAYLAASGAYLNAEALALEQRVDPDAVQVAFCFFLVKKLRGYVERLGLDRGQDWAVLDAKFTILTERAKLRASILSDLATVAQRIVAENSVFRFDSGESAFAAAEKTEDSAARAELLATGIRQLIDEGKYAEAAQRMNDLQEEKYRDQLNTYLSFRLAEASLKKLDWYTFNAQVNRVSDARLRTYLVISAALAASDARKKKMSSDFLLTAMAAFPKIEDPAARAAALVTAAGILYAGDDASWAAQVLTEGVNAINRANQYDGGAYTVTLEAANSKILLPLSKSDLTHCFEQAAKRDWQAALAAAQSIESKVLRMQAYIAACRNVL
ncbi:MAG TPA: hypothetical protein VFS90_07500 [Pyrinomonadaceae bacterium]|nr:hypothetical protein [Pyrinomonadaceae bacterium]